MMKWTSKDPEEKVDYTHKWADRLLVNGVAGDTIVTASDPDPTKHPVVNVLQGDVTVVSIIMAGTDMIVWLEGGTTPSLLDLIINTAGGRRYTQRVLLPIKER